MTHPHLQQHLDEVLIILYKNGKSNLILFIHSDFIRTRNQLCLLPVTEAMCVLLLEYLLSFLSTSLIASRQVLFFIIARY